MTTKKKSKFDNSKMVCDYCQCVQEQVMFCIGASRQADWVMHEGTGKISCPGCWEIGSEEGRKAIENHVNNINKRVGT